MKKTVPTIVIILVSVFIFSFIKPPEGHYFASFDSFGRIVAFLILVAVTGIGLYVVHKDK